MIDFHSHILPGIDDGSAGVQQSLRMLKALREQKVAIVCATSHFYATERSPESYLRRRDYAYEKLCEALPEDAPVIFRGAEVLYYPGISHMKQLHELCLEGTNLLLLEMPFTAWSRHMVQEVRDLAHSGEFTILLAHIERYYFQQPVSTWDAFLEDGIYMQSNADFFLPFRTRRKAIRLLREGRIHVLGTDCHNDTSRAPRMAEARDMIRRKLGEQTLADIDHTGNHLLRELLEPPADVNP